MRILPLALLFGFCLSGCLDQDERHSRELMNEGVEAFDAGEETMAIEALQDATTYDPENHRAWFALGQVHGAREEWEEAAEAYAEAVKYEQEDAMYHYRLGEALAESGDLGEAETALGAALERNDRLFRAWYYKGKVYNETDRPREAAEAWTRSAELNPHYGAPFIALGTLYARWDKVEEAISVLEQGSRHVREDADLTELYYELGLAYDSAQRHDDAVQAFTDALEASAGNVQARLQRGFVYAEMGEVEEAKDDLRQFVQQGGAASDFAVQAANDRLRRLRDRD